MLSKFKFVTGNPNKVREAEEILGLTLEPVQVDGLFEIQSPDLDEVVRHKAQQAYSALQWRLSMPLLVMIVALLAVPLSRTQPRRGRYAKMIPAILLYVIYLVACNAARGMLDEGKAPTPWLLWYVHGAFFSVAVLLLIWPSIHFGRSASPKAAQQGAKNAAD